MLAERLNLLVEQEAHPLTQNVLRLFARTAAQHPDWDAKALRGHFWNQFNELIWLDRVADANKIAWLVALMQTFDTAAYIEQGTASAGC